MNNEMTVEFKARQELCSELTEILSKHSDALSSAGFSPEMAKFDCLMTAKMIVDELYEELDSANAKKLWCRELLGQLRRREIVDVRG